MATKQPAHKARPSWLGMILLLAALLMNAESQAQQVKLTRKGSYSSDTDFIIFSAGDVQVAGKYAYVTGGGVFNDSRWQGLMVIDISEPAQPRRVGFYETSGSVKAVRVQGDYAYLIHGIGIPGVPGGLLVIDVKDPTQPHPVADYPTDGFPQDVEVVGNYAYVTDWSGEPFEPYVEAPLPAGLHVLDVSDPARPVRVGRYRTAVGLHSVRVAGHYAYLGKAAGSVQDPELQIIDVSVPANPVRVGGYAGRFGRAHVAGRYAYLPSAEGLEVIDVSNPRSPVRVGTYHGAGGRTNTVAWRGELEVFDRYAFLGFSVRVGNDSQPYLHVIDVSESAQPVRVGQYTPPGTGWVYPVQIVGQLVYLATSHGLLILEAQFPLVLNAPVLSADKLTLSWNGGAGIKLQTTPSLTAPTWQDVPATDSASSIELPLTEPSAFFRLIKP